MLAVGQAGGLDGDRAAVHVHGGGHRLTADSHLDRGGIYRRVVGSASEAHGGGERALGGGDRLDGLEQRHVAVADLEVAVLAVVHPLGPGPGRRVALPLVVVEELVAVLALGQLGQLDGPDPVVVGPLQLVRGPAVPLAGDLHAGLSAQRSVLEQRRAVPDADDPGGHLVGLGQGDVVVVIGRGAVVVILDRVVVVRAVGDALLVAADEQREEQQNRGEKEARHGAKLPVCPEPARALVTQA